MSPDPQLIASAAGGLIAGLAAGALACMPWYLRLTRNVNTVHSELDRVRGLLISARADALRDRLTGLSNRRAAYERLTALQATGQPFAVVMLDIDNLKTINDTLGHHAGDHVLRHVAARLTRLRPAPDLAARLDGDEFVLAIADPSTALGVADQAWHATAEPIDCNGHRLQVTVSVGVAVQGTDGDFGQVLHHADVAMYHAKRNRTGPQLYTPRMALEPMQERPAERIRDRPRP